MEDVLINDSGDSKEDPYANITHISDVPSTFRADTDSDSRNSSNSDSDDDFADERSGHSDRQPNMQQIARLRKTCRARATEIRTREVAHHTQSLERHLWLND